MALVVLYCTVMYYIIVSPCEQYITGLTVPEGQLRDNARTSCGEETRDKEGERRRDWRDGWGALACSFSSLSSPPL